MSQANFGFGFAAGVDFVGGGFAPLTAAKMIPGLCPWFGLSRQLVGPKAEPRALPQV
jgi:hypothetical protein